MRRTRVLGSTLAAALALAGCGGAEHAQRHSGGPPSASHVGDATREADGVIPEIPPLGRTSPSDRDGSEVGAAGTGGTCDLPADPLKDLAVVQQATLCLLNAERSARRLAPLRSNPKLAAAAAQHSLDMVRRRYFAHDTLGGGSFDRRIVRVGYLRGARAWAIGENLAWGSGVLAAPVAIVSAWMKSPGHRANILDRRFREIGLGLAAGAPQARPLAGLTYTTDFGARR